MINFRIGEQEISIPRNIGLLDTNVLVALLDDKDGHNAQATLVYEYYDDYEWAVTLPVVVEACGLLGSRRGHFKVIELIRWVLDPGKKIWLLPGSHPMHNPNVMLTTHYEWMGKYVTDYVDAHLMELAHYMTQQFNLRPHTPIFTFDTKDFFRCANQGRLYSLYDMDATDLIDFSS